ncbi:MAG: chemotaxis protein CheW [Panacagrimonas sp.]|jgi:chemotaxis-related protein WspD|nr:chemotaxis protein CheW [Panacagrimonas sp.]MCC2656918.1 chemotaxis protein CheW [Panacagrimonas sp.]
MTPTAGEGVGDCWNRIGVAGDRSCARLAQHVHCRNCPVFSQAASRFLDRDVAPDQIVEWTRLIARPATVRERDSQSVVIFRLGPEWLALRTEVFAEVASPRALHALPHRRSPVLLGVVNLNGALVTCVSLATLLMIDMTVQPRADLGQLVHPRLLVLRRGRTRVAVPADEVQAVHRHHPHDVRPLPSTVSGAAAAHTRGVLAYLDRSVGLLDEAALFDSLDLHLA